MRPSKSLSLRFAALAFAAWVAAMDAASAQDAARDYRIAEQSLGQALREFALASNLDLLFSPDLVSGKKSPSLDGKFTVDEGLRTLLRGSGLEFSVSGSRVVISEPKIEPARQATSSSSGLQGTNGYTRLAQAESMPSRPSSPAASAATTEGADLERFELEEIVVTGTHVKGVKDRFSPVTQIRREQMDLAGHANVSDVLDSLPQNFGGGNTPDTVPAGSTTGTGAASVNLRGLGNEATLVLLNGRRLAPGGLGGDFVDISAIPVSAIDRIEVVSDGASAIYGSDAVAGVVNIILRDDFTGAESRLNLGGITDGGGETIKLGQTLGFRGARARGLVTYEYSSEEELNANDKAFSQALPDPFYLIPSSRKHSVFATAGTALSDRVRISGDAYYNSRESEGFVTTSPPLINISQDVDVKQYGGAAGLNLRLGDAWEGDVDFSYSKSEQKGDAPLVIFGSLSRTLVDATSEIVSVDASAGGSLFHMTDEPVRAVFGGHYRSEAVDALSHSLPVGSFTDVEKSRDILAVYGELYAPLVSQADAIPGVERLALTLAARYDDYSDVGTSFDPKAGVTWSPFAGFSLRGSYGTSFRASKLYNARDELTSVSLVRYVDPSLPGGEATALQLVGFTSDLDPEQAESWTAGFDFAPQGTEGLQLRGTYFSIDYTDRIGIPAIALNSAFKFQNFTGIPILNPSAATVDAHVNSALSFTNFGLIFPSLGTLNLADVSVILDRRNQNLAESKVEGIDLEVSFTAPTDTGDWSFFLNSTILTEYTQKAAPLAPLAELLNTYNNPIDLRVRSGLSWRRSSLTANFTVNYATDYIDDEALTGPTPIHSWTTIDASLRVDLGKAFAGGLARDAVLSFSVTNLLNEDPPLIVPGPLRASFYDTANANPAGRRIGVVLTKRW